MTPPPTTVLSSGGVAQEAIHTARVKKKKNLLHLFQSQKFSEFFESKLNKSPLVLKIWAWLWLK